MVDTFSHQYTMPVMNESGYVVILSNVANSEDLVQHPHPDPYAQSATKLFPVGTKLIRGEQVWRYCYNGDTLLNIAAPIQSPKIINGEADDDITGLSATAIGSNIVYLTSTSNLATSPADERDEYAEGYLYFNNLAGEGQCRKIKHSEPFGSTLEIKIELYEDLTIGTTLSTTEAGIIRNPYWMVEDTESVVSGMCVGVPGIPVTINYYFWAQTGGPCAVLTNAVINLGTTAVVGTTVANIDPGNAATAEIIIGYPMSPGVTELEYALIFLTLD